MTKSFISQAEKGLTTPSVAALVVIARRLGRTLDYFVSDKSESPLKEIANEVGIAPDVLERTIREMVKRI